MNHINRQTEKARHAQARIVSHRHRGYCLFPGLAAQVLSSPNQGPVLIAGGGHSGRTFALLNAAVALVKSTPRGFGGKKNLIRMFLRDDNKYWVYATLNALFTGSDRLDLCPTTRQESLAHFSAHGFDFALVESDFVKQLKRDDKYDVIHVLTEYPLMLKASLLDSRTFTETGLTVAAGHAKDNATREALMAGVSFITRRGVLTDDIYVYLARCKHAPAGLSCCLGYPPKMQFG